MALVPAMVKLYVHHIARCLSKTLPLLSTSTQARPATSDGAASTTGQIKKQQVNQQSSAKTDLEADYQTIKLHFYMAGEFSLPGDTRPCAASLTQVLISALGRSSSFSSDR